jgi:hypothetical protein
MAAERLAGVEFHRKFVGIERNRAFATMPAAIIQFNFVQYSALITGENQAAVWATLFVIPPSVASRR